MPSYLAALLFCAGVIAVVALITVGQKWLLPWPRRFLIIGSLLLALLMSLYLAMTLLLVIRD